MVMWVGDSAQASISPLGRKVIATKVPKGGRNFTVNPGRPLITVP
jgi:hypothetical protein